MATVNLSSIITPSNVLTAASAATLTNKTINIASNTLTGVQPTLVSGTSIKTVNSTSLLGSGDIALSSGLTLLSTVNASASADVNIETTFSSTYDAYMLVISGARPSTDTASLLARMKIGGSYITTSTYISTGGYNSLGGNQETTLATEITLVSYVWGNDAPSSCDVVMYIFNPASTTLKKQMFYQSTSVRLDTGASQVLTRSGVGLNNGTAALTGMRFFASSGNITSGTFRLYGIANS